MVELLNQTPFTVNNENTRGEQRTPSPLLSSRHYGDCVSQPVSISAATDRLRIRNVPSCEG